MRKIIHIDMDCFYAAIEIRDNPSLKNLPVAVGGSEINRGVICTCNYLARKYGIHSAMATSKAYRMCPDLIVMPVNMIKYKEISVEIRKIFLAYTKSIEPISLDEAYLDVTDCSLYHGSATWIANSIRGKIFEQFNLTSSAGVAPNKFLAKIASDWQKPNGQFVIEPEQVAEFIEQLKIEKIPGVGRATTKRLHRLGIYICKDIQNYPVKKLIAEFGKFGNKLIELSFGKDGRTVKSNVNRKSFSIERTFPVDIQSINCAKEQLMKLSIELKHRMQSYQDREIHKQFVKIKFNNFFSTTIERRSQQLSIDLFMELFIEGYARQQLPIRLLGLGLRFANQEKPYQLPFLELA